MATTKVEVPANEAAWLKQVEKSTATPVWKKKAQFAKDLANAKRAEQEQASSSGDAASSAVQRTRADFYDRYAANALLPPRPPKPPKTKSTKRPDHWVR